MFRIVGYDDPLVVVGSQGNLGHTFGRDGVFSRAQGVKLCTVRCFVLKTILVMFNFQGVLHDTLFNSLTFLSSISHTPHLSTVTVARLSFAHVVVLIYLARVLFRSETDGLGYRSSARLVLHSSRNLLVHPWQSCRMVFRIRAGVEHRGNVISGVLEEVLGMNFVCERVGVCVACLGVVPVFWFHITVMPFVHRHLRAIQDGYTVLDRFVQTYRGRSHSYRHQLRVLEYERSSEVWFGSAS